MHIRYSFSLVAILTHLHTFSCQLVHPMSPHIPLGKLINICVYKRKIDQKYSTPAETTSASRFKL